MNLSILAAAADSIKVAKLTSAPLVKVDKKTVYLNGVRGSQGPQQTITIQNRTSSAFKLVDASFGFTGPNASSFAITGGRTNRTLQPGAKATYGISFRPGSDASLSDVFTASLSIKASSAPSASAVIALRAIATGGEGGNLEPSLARVMELYQYTIDVGDTDPSTTTLDLDGSTTDEALAPRFVKAAGGPVTITPVANFVSAAAEPGRIGYYRSGLPDSLTELYHYDADYAQSVSPVPNGSTTFDPGTGAFGVYAQIPVFRNVDGTARTIYSEDAFNTWEPNAANQRKVRVYPLIEKQKAVANAYVVTFEDFTVNDQNDYVYVIRNVATLTSRAKVGLIAQNGQPTSDRMVFSNIGTKNSTYPNYVTTSASVKVVNTGNRDLVISSLSLSGEDAGAFQIVNPPASPVTVRRNGAYTLTVNFVASTTTVMSGTLNINSNDKLTPKTTISLAGYWQQFSEHADNNQISVEPSLPEIFSMFGTKTIAVGNGQSLNTNGGATAVGDEVLSTYWQQADASLPVSVQILASYHQQRFSTEVAWYLKGQPYYSSTDARYTTAAANGPRNSLFFTNNLDGQTVLPRNRSGTPLPGVGTFASSGVFGFRVDAELSDDALNITKSGNSGAHHIRFYPYKDASGKFVANTYLMIMDSGAINFDFNDNLYLVRNVHPAEATGAVTGFNGYSSSDEQAVLDWSTVAGATGYTVQRATARDGAYETIASDIVSSNYTDDAKAGKTWYYRVFANGDGLDLDGMPALTSVHINTV